MAKDGNVAPAAVLHTFVEGALAHVGAEHVWLSRELVRVGATPALADLFGDAATLDLALTPEALVDWPAALLCAPGSFAFDALLERCRATPAGFSTRLEPSEPGGAPPPGLPELANGTLVPERRELSTGTAVFALFRVSLHSDELVERLVPVLVDAAGTLRPELAERVERRGRCSQPGGVEVPAPFLATLEAEIQRRTAELAGALIPEIRKRKAEETARLESYLATLREDLHREFPPALLMQVDGIRAQAEMATAAFRTLAAGAFPCERDRLLALLEPKPQTGFTRPYDPVSQLPDATRRRLAEVLRALPERFYPPAFEGAMAQDSAARLKALGAWAETGQPLSEVIAEREQRLEEEHRARIADIEHKFHLRVTSAPALLETISYPLAEYELVVEGDPELRTTATWDTLAEEWRSAPCPGCGEAAARWWLCERGHLACEACAGVCVGCGRARCRSCAFRRCADCHRPACPDCGTCCARCDSWSCREHAPGCPLCDQTTCSRCGGSCHVCGRGLCDEHHEACALCHRQVCAEHALTCRVCRRVACSVHARRCAICRDGCCRDHRATCASCRQEYCSACCVEGRCETCRSLEPAGGQTALSLARQLAHLCGEPALESHRRWLLARNARYRVAVARGWPRSRIFVVDEETGALAEQRKRWDWLP
jgi:hypothetical protein